MAGSDDGSWKSAWWQCKVCSGWTKIPKQKCHKCGVRKQWAEWYDDAPTDHSAPCNDVHVEVDIDSPKSGDVDVLQRNIRSLEASLAALPDSAAFVDTRDHIKKQIDTNKKLITQSKPLPAQLASCSAALARARARRLQAEEAIRKAQDDLTTANQAVFKLEADAKKIEGEMAASSTGGNSLVSMANALQEVLNDMSSSTAVPKNVVDEAKAAMVDLYTKINIVATQARTSSLPPNAKRTGITRTSSDPLMSPGAERSAPVPRRCDSKTTDKAGVCVPLAGGPPLPNA